MGKHTPGPWKFGQLSCTVQAGARLVCSLDARGEESDPHFLADARLIAAAPELLEALREAVTSVDAGAIEHSEDCAQERDNIVAAHNAGRPLSDCSCWVGRARAAIAKATGVGNG